MARTPIRKPTKRRSWNVESLSRAMKAVHFGLSRTQAAIQYGIPKRTLRRYLDRTEHPKDVKLAQLGSFAKVFSPQQEEQLATYAIEMGQCFYGLTALEMRSLAYQMAERNGIPHPFHQEHKVAGPDWLKSFLQRHPNISLRTPENTSIARARGFNRESVAQFFDLLERIFDEHPYPPSRVINVDETCVGTVQERKTKVLANKGQHQVGRLVSAERGENATVTMAMSASGTFMDPFFIFPRQRMHDALKVGAPPESTFACNPTGWSTLETFSQWFDNFLKCYRPTKEDPVLLILDGHSSHTRNLEVLEKARANHTRIISIPPHTSHKLQPLDVSFMAPFKGAYSDALDRLLKRNGGNPITIYNIATLVNEAFKETAKKAVAQNGFKSTGITPFDRNVFPDADFAPSDFLGRAFNDNVSDSSPNTSAVQCVQPSILTGCPGPAENEVGFNPDQNQIVDLQQLTGNDAGLVVIEPDNDLLESILDISTFYFADENGNLSSLVVQYTDHDSTIIPHCGEITACPANSVELPTQNDPNTIDLVKDPTSLEDQEPSLLIPEDQDPSSSTPEDLDSSSLRTTKKRRSQKPKSSDLSVHVTLPKHRRWDHNLPNAADRCANFDFPLVLNDELKVRTELQKVKKRQINRKKEHCEDLTSSPYRKKLKQAQASKDIKNIKKRPTRKPKAKQDRKEDIICPTCGCLFSGSANGDGWQKCITCSEWFHIECQRSDNEPLKCFLCS